MNETNAGGVRHGSAAAVVPVLHEAHVRADSVSPLHAHLEASFPFPFPCRITVAENASPDGTRRAATDPTRTLPSPSSRPEHLEHAS
jgi:hypothetical protein